MVASREGLPYTKEEELIIEELLGSYSFNTIAKRLNRSPKAIERKVERMGLINTKLSSGLISAHELSKALGVSHKLLLKWREQYGLPLMKKNIRFGARKQNSWHIYPNEFWEWAENHKEILNWNKYKRDSLFPEPDWLEKAIIDCNKPKNTKRLWTPEEDNLLWDLFYTKGLPQKEIAKRMHRSVSGVEKRLKRLREARLERCYK